jgi:hypothetical protein
MQARKKRKAERLNGCVYTHVGFEEENPVHGTIPSYTGARKRGNEFTRSWKIKRETTIGFSFV